MWNSLHNHTYFSLLDGLCAPEEMVATSAEYGYSAMAITDHGTISGVPAFEKACKKHSIKGIYGNELYTTMQPATIKDKSNGSRTYKHLIVLAKNTDGWKNLVKLTSRSNDSDLFYYKPRVDLEILSEYSKNLIAFSGHLGSHLAHCLYENDCSYDGQLRDNPVKNAIHWISMYQEIFGKENFFVEIQLIDSDKSPESKVVAEILREAAKQVGAPCIATGDSHYAKREQAELQRILLCSNLKTTLNKVNKALENDDDVALKGFFVSDNFCIPEPDYIVKFHSEEELQNTQVIADMCEAYSILDKPRLPKFETPNNMSEKDYLVHLCEEGLDKRKKSGDEYRERLEHELKIITDADLSGYFLMVQDYVNWAKNQGWLIGPGRGCFLPGSTVIMADGSHEDIAEIQIGDYVLDAYGHDGLVTNKFRYEIDEEIIELEFDNGVAIRCTKDHKFLTKNRGWVAAQFLDADDDISQFHHYYMELAQKTTKKYTGPVYDLSVSGSQTYNIEGVSVHNSAGGALIAYLLGITEVDPLEYGLLFGRFYNEGRNTKDNVSLPDIDVDFPRNKREYVMDYIREKYGHSSVAQIVTFGRLMGRGALKEVLRICSELSYSEITDVTKNIPDEAAISDKLEEFFGDNKHSIIEWVLHNEPSLVSNYCSINEDGKLSGPLSHYFEQAIAIEGTIKSTSKHAAGVIISNVDLNEAVPMIKDKSNDDKIAGFDMNDMEKCGHVKFDILGLSTLDRLTSINELLEFGEIISEAAEMDPLIDS